MTEIRARTPRLPADALFKVAVAAVLAFLVWDRLHPRVAPGPAPDPETVAVAPDPEVVALGKDYGIALLEAAANSLEAGSTEGWADVVTGKTINRRGFNEGLLAAMDPLAVEQARRFGAATPEPIPATEQAPIRAFWRDLGAGIREAKAP